MQSPETSLLKLLLRVDQEQPDLSDGGTNFRKGAPRVAEHTSGGLCSFYSIAGVEVVGKMGMGRLISRLHPHSFDQMIIEYINNYVQLTLVVS